MVLSPLEYTGLLATLIGGYSSGSVPYTVQYSGRYISQMNVKLLKTELEAPGTTGKIQFGNALGNSDQVIVPACFGPLAAASGTAPIPPGTVTDPGVVVVVELWLLLLLQAASPVRLATATATPAVLYRNFMSESPFCRSSPAIRSVTAARASGSRYPPVRDPYPPAPPCRPALGRPVYTGELAEA